jgi:hypothetical protein
MSNEITTNPYYPKDPEFVQRLQGEGGATVERVYVANYKESPVASNSSGILAAVADSGIEQVIVTGFAVIDVPRNITATALGTAGDVGAIVIVIEGTDAAGNDIVEALPAFTVDALGTVSGVKAFKTVTKITLPAHDGTGALTAFGWGNTLGLIHKLPYNSFLMASFNGVRESVDPTVVVSANLENNTVTFNSTLDGSEVQFSYLI